MIGQAPRPASRMRRALVRGALLALGLWLPGAASADISAARYGDLTDRYQHAVLGDDLEYGSLTATLSDGTIAEVRLPRQLVFEDTAPRLVDIDGDGARDVLVTESHETKGARVAVYAERDGKLTRIAATPHIGTRFRWLGIVGATDLDGDGLVEIAYVDRPHLAKTLRIWRATPGADGDVTLQEVASVAGVTNHRIGEDYISGGLTDCYGASEMIVADARWQRVLAVSFDGADLTARDIGPFTGRRSMDPETLC